jgi:hypothetical protein
MNRAFFLLFGVFFISLSVGCDSPHPTQPTQADPSFLIGDAAHGNGGFSNFYWLPPLVPDPDPQGVFDGSLDPEVRICRLNETEEFCVCEEEDEGGGCMRDFIAEFHSFDGMGSTLVRVDPAEEHYIVNWATKDYDLDPSSTYRISVWVFGVQLGFADVDLVRDGRELKNVNTGQYVPLNNGRTLPIRFWIKEGSYDCAGQSQIPAIECQALVTLYNKTGGFSWRNHIPPPDDPVEPWLVGSEPCAWFGVECEEGIATPMVVTELRLSWNGLNGMIPPEIGDFEHLRVLDWRGNALTGPLPPEVGNLAALEVLELRANALFGEIPPQLGNLASLRFLNLNGNQFTGPIPPELGNLEDLIELRLYWNQLAGPIPAELGGMEDLELLALQANQLSGPIPAELGGLSKLWLLFLHQNQLAGPIPPELSSLMNLRWINLQGNLLDGPVPLEVAQWAVTGPNRFPPPHPPPPFRCNFVPPGNEGLFIPYAPEYMELGAPDNQICGLPVWTPEKVVDYMIGLIVTYFPDPEPGVPHPRALEIIPPLHHAMEMFHQGQPNEMILGPLYEFFFAVFELFEIGELTFEQAESLIKEDIDLILFFGGEIPVVPGNTALQASLSPRD